MLILRTVIFSISQWKSLNKSTLIYHLLNSFPSPSYYVLIWDLLRTFSWWPYSPMHKALLPESAGIYMCACVCLLTFLNEVVPFLGPSLETLGVRLLYIRTLLYQLHEICAQFVAILDALGGAFIVSRLPERVARSDEHVIVTVVRHGASATYTTAPPVHIHTYISKHPLTQIQG